MTKSPFDFSEDAPKSGKGGFSNKPKPITPVVSTSKQLYLAYYGSGKVNVAGVGIFASKGCYDTHNVFHSNQYRLPITKDLAVWFKNSKLFRIEEE